MRQATDVSTDVDKLFSMLGLPHWVTLPVVILIVLGAVVAGTNILWRELPGARRWLARRRQGQRRVDTRGRFAGYLESQMRRTDARADWRDDRFAELEADVEVRRPQGIRRHSRGTEIRRVSALSTTLETSVDKVVALEGEPGSGKTVVLRHLAAKLASRVYRRPSETEPLPLYVNLEEFTALGEVNTEDLRAFVLGAVNRGRDREVDRYLEEEFDRGLAAGTWLFLFDSLDGIPAIRSATEPAAEIEKYTQVIHDFLHGANRCRGIVASREFPGAPRVHDWPRFRVLALSRDRQVNLVRRAGLKQDEEHGLIDNVRNAPAEIQAMVGNPLFLGLLCDQSRSGGLFPANTHAAVDSYVRMRVIRDALRVSKVFAVETDLLLAVVDQLVLRNTGQVTPGRGHAEPLRRKGLAAAVDALERVRQGSEEVTGRHGPGWVIAEALVANGRWRDTAVTILQSQGDPDKLAVYQALWLLCGTPRQRPELTPPALLDEIADPLGR
ncbi:NACHT domain-containing protein [Actinokineospora diospyrosa]|uniref:NACHT domain-containing protein n=1 Tax=Actinokineospora diospyrosa TaxID=103728 RepID=A0ABT1I8P6_9PSEU|nr:NACHT domain-containing protein [Actinokineospora diospyrosa]MCP2269010.1 NACHT domain-containing protein [Actinokineospora diospyrosa]